MLLLICCNCFVVVIGLLLFRSEEWSKVTKKDRTKLGIEVADDGEFW